MISNYTNFDAAIIDTLRLLKEYGAIVNTGKWQGVSTAGKPDLLTQELMDVAFRVSMDQPRSSSQPPEAHSRLGVLAYQINPNLPWADDHFTERVSRVPSNPGEQYKNWPWWRGQEKFTFAEGAEVYDKADGKFKFSHTYQERFWPKHAGTERSVTYNRGIRYNYGDLDDVVNMLVKDPHTRQAYLPIFFPEDTGAVHGGRIPCTLGYHFLLRNDCLHLWYDIRSCDAVRHFRDDLYLAARLALWMIEECKQRELLDVLDTVEDHSSYDYLWEKVRPGIMTFHAHSFHVHKGDMHLL